MSEEKNDPLDFEQTVERAVDESLGDEKTLSGGAVCGVVDRYELIEKLGQGGFGAVYRARDKEAGVEVALKALPTLISHSPDEIQSVRANFALVSKLVHSGIANLKHLHKIEHPDDAAKQALGVSPGDYLVVMECVLGSTLSAWRAKFPSKQVPVEQTLEICRQIAEALDYAHSQKIIHRDVKPSNVMVGMGTKKTTSNENGSSEPLVPSVVKVLDFGLAAEIRSSMSRVSQEQGDSSGTRPYMAPEQWVGGRQRAQTDQYALAVLFCELVSGTVPFQSVFETGDMRLMRDVVKSESVEPLDELDAKQNSVLLRALSKNPKDRFSCCLQMMKEFSAEGVTESSLKGDELVDGTVNCPICNYKGDFIPQRTFAGTISHFLLCFFCASLLLGLYYGTCFFSPSDPLLLLSICYQIYLFSFSDPLILILICFICVLTFRRSIGRLKCPHCKNIAFSRSFFRPLLIIQSGSGFRMGCTVCNSTEGGGL